MLMRFGHKMDSTNKISHNIKADAGRIAKHMARAGVCSRRDAERLIADRRVTLNGVIVESPAVNVTDADVICVDGRRVAEPEKARLWRYHKTKGQVTTGHDPQGRETVFDRLPEGLPRLISIGRLDYNTEGLLLFTNDGALSRHLELPSTGWLRRYRVRVNGRPRPDALAALSNGIEIDGVRYGAIEARMDGREQSGANTWLTIGIREGKNREVRKVMDHLGLQVTRLIRVSFGPFALGEMPPGEIEEVKTRVLAEQLGAALAEEFGLKAAAAQAALRPEPRMYRGGFRAEGSQGPGGEAKRRAGAAAGRPPVRAPRPAGASRRPRPGGEPSSGRTSAARDGVRERGRADGQPERRRKPQVSSSENSPRSAERGSPARVGSSERGRFEEDGKSANSTQSRGAPVRRARSGESRAGSADSAGEKKPWVKKDRVRSGRPDSALFESVKGRDDKAGAGKPRQSNEFRDGASRPPRDRARPESEGRRSDERRSGPTSGQTAPSAFPDKRPPRKPRSASGDAKSEGAFLKRGKSDRPAPGGRGPKPFSGRPKRREP